MNLNIVFCISVLCVGCSNFSSDSDIEKLRPKLKDSKFDIDAIHEDGNGEYSLLTKAAERGDFAMVKFLVEHGANIQAPNRGLDLINPLNSASDLDIVEYLLRRGADVNGTAGMAGITKLHAAAAQGDLEMVTLLLKYNADCNLTLCNGNMGTALHYACEYYNDDSDRSWWGPERPHRRKYLEVIKTLIQHGADVNKKDRYGKTPINLNLYL
ncbi:MAG: ankyrin repeat domain-containing protein [Holosporales bacterium]|jgi:ankyrin repeat protein|nr:ankyrin repeat domain-containing protein [Holosporales bacterium]